MGVFILGKTINQEQNSLIFCGNFCTSLINFNTRNILDLEIHFYQIDLRSGINILQLFTIIIVYIILLIFISTNQITELIPQLVFQLPKNHHREKDETRVILQTLRNQFKNIALTQKWLFQSVHWYYQIYILYNMLIIS